MRPDLGVNAIQVLPPAEFPGGFSWGYNPSSIFAVETDYGGPQALRTLIRAAHEHGLAVLCGVVCNHSGWAYSGTWRFHGWHEPGKGGIYYNDWRDRTPWGHTRPDYGRPEVRSYLRDNALTWLEQFRFDGLRWDATSYIRNVDGTADPGADLPDGWRLLRQINSEVDSASRGRSASPRTCRSTNGSPSPPISAGPDSTPSRTRLRPRRHRARRLQRGHPFSGRVRHRIS